MACRRHFAIYSNLLNKMLFSLSINWQLSKFIIEVINQLTLVAVIIAKHGKELWVINCELAYMTGRHIQSFRRSFLKGSLRCMVKWTGGRT